MNNPIKILVGVFLLTLIVFTAVAKSAQAAKGQSSSFFAATDDNAKGMTLPYKNTEYFPADMFDASSVGVFAYTDGTFRANGYTGLVKVTGACYRYLPDGNTINVYAHSADGKFLIASSLDKFIEFVYVTDSQWLQFSASISAQGYNTLKCALVFEAMK